MTMPSLPVPWMDSPSHRAWLDNEAKRLLEFGTAAAIASGGAAYLDDDGRPDLSQGIQTWITCRTVHSFSLGHLMGVPGSAATARAAMDGLTGVLRDAEHGGWWDAVDADGVPARESGKGCYAHAFVMLASASATMAGLPGAVDLLDEATSIYLERFWDDTAGRPRDTWNADFTRCDTYRGVNSTMHSVEAMLAVADAMDLLGRGDEAGTWRRHAARAADLVVRLAAEYQDRLPEHFDQDWVPDLELNRDRPGDRFKPFGATVGHGLEWSRLLLSVEAVMGDEADPRLLPTAVALFDRAIADGWAVDGVDGFVYTTDFEGTPVVRTRMHWVAVEAISTAATLYARTGDAAYAHWYATWWDYCEQFMIDRARGSWFHELDEQNRPTAQVWSGKPDIYHALQATLFARIPVAGSPGGALATGGLR